MIDAEKVRDCNIPVVPLQLVPDAFLDAIIDRVEILDVERRERKGAHKSGIAVEQGAPCIITKEHDPFSVTHCLQEDTESVGRVERKKKKKKKKKKKEKENKLCKRNEKV